MRQICFSLVCTFAVHLTEVCVDILFAFLVQLCAAELLCESGDADDVSRFQMFVEEITAGLGYVLHLISYRRKKNTGSYNI